MSERALPICSFCKKQIIATINDIPFCGCKKSIDAAIAIVSRKLDRATPRRNSHE